MGAEDPTDLFAELAADQGHAGGSDCGWRLWLATLPDDEARQWHAAVHDRRFTLASVARALKRREVPIGRSTLERHRAGVCKQCQT